MTALRQHFGLDQPVLLQLVSYLVHLAHFDLGYSARFGMPVSRLILERLPNTMLLMASGLGMALVLGILAGWVMAIFAGRWPDRILQVVVLLFYFDTRLLDRADGDRAVLGRARLAAVQWQRNHRRVAIGSCPAADRASYWCCRRSPSRRFSSPSTHG